jgi:hypothetical protein
MVIDNARREEKFHRSGEEICWHQIVDLAACEETGFAVAATSRETPMSKSADVVVAQGEVCICFRPRNNFRRAADTPPWSIPQAIATLCAIACSHAEEFIATTLLD